MNYQQLFESLYPGFFQATGINEKPADQIFTELVMDLRRDTPRKVPFVCPEGLTFDEYRGKNDPLQDVVRQVDENWVQYFSEDTPVFCAFDRDRIVAFCILSDWGWHQGMRIGGPGCVGTVPEYRKKGIGLEMVRQATNLLQKRAFDLSWIHYTHLEHWYRKLGYQPVLKWNCRGFLPDVNQQNSQK